ncbi:MAG: hypothetical protein UX39_C0015G0003 [Candidatus Magasanikbacteria bacterium GW2011_GWA2_46_17]|uniref:Uncharacterized protein n=1 Tax=Candidatus Magasanikbacteria bacterium GW2011_GWA2_46_17 TaxID=1619042 RepID=A0A0G1RYE2_9BACT|nr:MAG: hypothetical protein UX39_C0015G0003 [Candidatus Magasanikbacteria bacterium GW2011_GWA2_46_17]
MATKAQHAQLQTILQDVTNEVFGGLGLPTPTVGPPVMFVDNRGEDVTLAKSETPLRKARNKKRPRKV